MALKLNLERQDLSLPKMKFVHKVKVLLKDAFINKWTHDLYDDTRKNTMGNKLRTYRLFKNNFRMEQYLLVIKSAKLKKNLTQLRVSSHKLHIETGRHSQPYKDPS